MASYIRFEAYIPVHFVMSSVDSASGESKSIRHSLDDALLARFMREAVERFGGATQAHPMGNPPSRGLWWSKQFGEMAVDDLTYIFVMVPVHQFDEAVQFFEGWRALLMRETNQEAILISYWPVNTIGDFL